jgi:hypothetical protein
MPSTYDPPLRNSLKWQLSEYRNPYLCWIVNEEISRATLT